MGLLLSLGTLSWQVSPKRPERNLPPPSCVGDPCHASLPISLVSPKVGTTEMQTQGTGRVAYVVVCFVLLFIRERPRACVGKASQLRGVRQIGCWDKNRALKEVLRQSHFVGDTCFIPKQVGKGSPAQAGLLGTRSQPLVLETEDRGPKSPSWVRAALGSEGQLVSQR